MNASRSTRRGQVSIAALALLALLGIAAVASGLRIGGVTAAVPSQRPSAAPSGAPSPTPTVAPTKAPSPTPQGVPASVDLKDPSNDDVSILIHDQTGDLVGAESGTPIEGMSVAWHSSIVKNVDANSISVTWMGASGNDVADLGVSGTPGAYTITVVQAGFSEYSDTMGQDRILILTFDAPVSVEDISVEILDRTVDY